MKKERDDLMKRSAGRGRPTHSVRIVIWRKEFLELMVPLFPSDQRPHMHAGGTPAGHCYRLGDPESVWGNECHELFVQFCFLGISLPFSPPWSCGSEHRPVLPFANSATAKNLYAFVMKWGSVREGAREWPAGIQQKGK